MASLGTPMQKNAQILRISGDAELWICNEPQAHIIGFTFIHAVSKKNGRFLKFPE